MIPNPANSPNPVASLASSQLSVVSITDIVLLVVTPPFASNTNVVPPVITTPADLPPVLTPPEPGQPLAVYIAPLQQKRQVPVGAAGSFLRVEDPGYGYDAFRLVDATEPRSSFFLSPQGELQTADGTMAPLEIAGSHIPIDTTQNNLCQLCPSADDNLRSAQRGINSKAKFPVSMRRGKNSSLVMAFHICTMANPLRAAVGSR